MKRTRKFLWKRRKSRISHQNSPLKSNFVSIINPFQLLFKAVCSKNTFPIQDIRDYSSIYSVFLLSITSKQGKRHMNDSPRYSKFILCEKISSIGMYCSWNIHSIQYVMMEECFPFLFCRSRLVLLLCFSL